VAVIVDAETAEVAGEELENLLTVTYVHGGFTSPEIARAAFKADAVRARGQLLVARDVDGSLVGMVIVVRPDSSARRIARPDEIEMQLLAVEPECRGRGIGEALVEAALQVARHEPYTHMVLWTQPSMHAAQRLYERCGFERAPTRDMEQNGRPFWVYERSLVH